jgi:hypothetical protein
MRQISAKSDVIKEYLQVSPISNLVSWSEAAFAFFECLPLTSLSSLLQCLQVRYERYIYWVGSCLTRKQYTRLERFAWDKPSIFSYGENKLRIQAQFFMCKLY